MRLGEPMNPPSRCTNDLGGRCYEVRGQAMSSTRLIHSRGSQMSRGAATLQCGKNMLDVRHRDPRSGRRGEAGVHYECNNSNGQDLETNVMVKTRNYMSSRGKNCYGSLLRGSVVPTKFLLVLLDTLLVEDETSNALVVVWVGNGARCVSRDVTLHRLSAYS